MKNFIDLNKEKKQRLVFDKPGKYVVFFQNLSGELIFDIRSKDVDLDILGLYIGKDKDQFKVNTIQLHNAPSSSSNLLVKGVFDDESKFIHHGLIKIDKKGQKTKAYQKNQNLILSPRAFVESKPDLEILANDVFCTHGSTTGRLNEEEIYYLKSRGIDDKSARKLLVSGFINDILNKAIEHGYTKN